MLQSPSVRFFSSRVMKKPVQCYYKTLNVSANATSKELKAAYYEQAKKFHPDMNDTPEGEKVASLEEEMFKMVNEAYTMLNNPKTRAQYDKLIMGDEPQAQAFYDPTVKRSEQEAK